MENTSFEYFNDLSDELCACILSFVSTAPFEAIDNVPRGSLTHELPLLSKRIAHIVNTSNILWKEAIVRLCMKDLDIWITGVESIVENKDCATDSKDEVKRMVEAACDNIHTNELVQKIGCRGDLPPKRLFRYLVCKFLRVSFPAFVMQGEAIRGEEIHLHLFEPRYRLLVRELVEGFRIDEHGNLSRATDQSNNRTGSAPADHNEIKYPRFVYAYQGSLAIGSFACIVELRNCIIFEDGRANVTLVPCAHVKIESVWERIDSGSLYCVRCLRMGRKSSEMLEQINRRHRRYWINNESGIGEENHWVEGGTVNGRRVRGSISAILTFVRPPPQGR